MGPLIFPPAPPPFFCRFALEFCTVSNFNSNISRCQIKTNSAKSLSICHGMQKLTFKIQGFLYCPFVKRKKFLTRFGDRNLTPPPPPGRFPFPLMIAPVSALLPLPQKSPPPFLFWRHRIRPLTRCKKLLSLLVLGRVVKFCSNFLLGK